MTSTADALATPIARADAPRAVLHRMALPGHVCPYGVKALDLLRRRGYAVEDRLLRSREEMDRFKAEHGVRTTPQAFVDGARVGGYDDLRRHFGLKVREAGATSYVPVVVVFAVSGAMALAAAYASTGTIVSVRAAEWFVAFATCVLALLKLQDVEAFSTTFLNYDLLAKRWVPYPYLYPFAELLTGVLMIAGALKWVGAPVALLIGGVGAVSVIKAVYVERRDIKCACVGGSSRVPLGFVSLTENLMMVAMGAWKLAVH